MAKQKEELNSIAVQKEDLEKELSTAKNKVTESEQSRESLLGQLESALLQRDDLSNRETSVQALKNDLEAKLQSISIQKEGLAILQAIVFQRRDMKFN